jgi:hypothetical protein
MELLPDKSNYLSAAENSMLRRFEQLGDPNREYAVEPPDQLVAHLLD